MFKLVALRSVSAFVNLSFAAILIFLAACSETQNSAPVAVDKAERVHPAEPAYPLQAVWASRALDEPVTDLAFVGGSEPFLAAVYVSGALQFLTLDGDRLTSAEALNITALADGQAVVLQDTPLNLFPGIDRAGNLNLYTYSPVLDAPLTLPLLEDIGAAGLCAGPPLDETSLMQLAYWTEADRQTLHTGRVEEKADVLIFSPLGERRSQSGPIASCNLYLDIQIAPAEDALDLAKMRKMGKSFTLARTAEDRLTVTQANSKTVDIELLPGITILLPDEITALAALSEVRYGGYPNGIIVIAGPVGQAHQIIFLNPTSLFEALP